MLLESIEPCLDFDKDCKFIMPGNAESNPGFQGASAGSMSVGAPLKYR